MELVFGISQYFAGLLLLAVVGEIIVSHIAEWLCAH